MQKYLIPILTTVGCVAVLCSWRTSVIRARNKRRSQLMDKPLPDAWLKILEKNIPLYARLPEELQQQLNGLIQIFLDEKKFEGCGGLEITDEVRVTIAAQASMLLLNRKTRFYPKLKTIYVYPSSYTAKSEFWDSGMIRQEKSIRQGESWMDGPVVLAWNSVTGGARNIRDGRNVVFHEFAHQLDQEDGTTDGAPILESNSSYQTWARVFGCEYLSLRNDIKKRRRNLIRRYGATNPGEFFAVVTEIFFEKPKQMNRKHPELYEELKNYYKLDPLEWKKKA